MKILLLGANGQVGWELRRTLAPLGEVTTVARSGDCDRLADASDLDALRRLLDEAAPDIVVNAAAYTAVDQAESETDLAMRMNAELPALLGRWAAERDALVAHYSTDYVFDGTKDSPYVEADAPNPLGVYGRSKLAGDEALLASDCDTLILRVSWVYGARGKNFLLTMQRLMAERDALRIVDDQIGGPTWCRRIAETTATALARMLGSETERAHLSGLYNFAPAGETSWYGFAAAIRDAGGFDCALTPITTADYPTPAARPANSRLDTAKLQHAFGITPENWQADLAACLEDVGHRPTYGSS
jgi:dTDP-4-dehydrorhamnose reductase